MLLRRRREPRIKLGIIASSERRYARVELSLLLRTAGLHVSMLRRTPRLVLGVASCERGSNSAVEVLLRNATCAGRRGGSPAMGRRGIRR